jgi:hypothetical protein
MGHSSLNYLAITSYYRHGNHEPPASYYENPIMLSAFQGAPAAKFPCWIKDDSLSNGRIDMAHWAWRFINHRNDQ